MTRTTSPPSAVSAALARDRLDVSSVVFFVLSGVAPLTVAAGVVTTAYATTGSSGIPIAFLAVAIVLGLFSVGYVAMARHITNAGAFYAFVARGLGRPLGVGAALVAVVAYNLLQVGLYGAFGPGMASYGAETFGVHAPWWLWALGAWAVVTVIGLLRVDLNGKVLAVLLSAEILIVLGLTARGLLHPADGHVSLATLAPTNLFASGIGSALVIAVLGYVGFESAAVFSEEARNPRRTVPMATYFSLALIAVVYAGASWAMAVHYGDRHVARVAQEQGPETLFGMANGFLADAGRTLYLTSLFAAMLAFHSFVTRYMFALGREGVLPRALERTERSGSPVVASSMQSLLGVVVIAVYALMGWDPLVKLFFWLGTTGAFGVLLLIALTSMAVIGFFARQPSGEPLWRRVIAPGIASIALAVMIWLATDNYAGLLGVPPGTAVATWLPNIYGIAVVVGVNWALVLKVANSQVYAAIGLGAEAVTGRTRPAATVGPRSRDLWS